MQCNEKKLFNNLRDECFYDETIFKFVKACTFILA